MSEATSGTKINREELHKIKSEISQLKETLKTTRSNLKAAMDRRDQLLKQAGRERKGKKEKSA